MNITSTITQITALKTAVDAFKTYLEGLKSAATVAHVDTKADGEYDVLGSEHTYYGVPESVVDDIIEAKSLINVAKKKCEAAVD